MGFSLGSDYGLPVPGETLVTATGSTQADAYQLRQQMTVFATVDSGTGAILPSSYSANASVTVANRGANALLLYPGEGDLIEGNSVNAPFTVAAGSQVNLVSFDPPLAASPRTWWLLGLISGVVHIIGGSIDGTTIGASIPSTGAFTSLTSTSGALNGSIGATTPAAGFFTALAGSVTATSSLTSRTLADRAADWVNVKDYGAVLNGTTDDTTAINAARGAVLTNGTVKVPAGGWFNSSTPTAGPSTPILWQMTGNSFTTGTTPVTGIGTDVVETFFGGNKFFGRISSVPDGPGVLRVDQHLTHTGGTSHFTTSAILANTFVTGNNANSNWGMTSVVHSTSNGGGRGVATIGYSYKDANGDEAFGANFLATDTTGNASSVSGAIVATEFDVVASGGLDDGGVASALIPAGAGVRVGLDVLGYQTTGGSSTAEIGYLVRAGAYTPGVNPSGPWSSTATYAKRVFTAIGSVSIAAYDASLATITGTGNAFRMASGQTFAFDGTTNTRTLSYVTADTALEYKVAGTTRFSVSDTGVMSASALATGGTTARTLAAMAADWNNAKSVGATGNTQYKAATVTATLSGTTIATTESLWAASDVGKPIVITITAGTVVLLPAGTTIATYVSPTQITVSAGATAAETSAPAYIGWGTNDLTALNAAAAIGPVFLPPGGYYTGQSIFATTGNKQFGGGAGGALISLEGTGAQKQSNRLVYITSAPAPPLNGYWNGDFSNVPIQLQTYITGANTLTKPTNTYYTSYVTTPLVAQVYNSSGWQEQVLGNGRTATFFGHVSLTQAGQGDMIGLNITGTVSGQNAVTPINWQGSPTIGFGNADFTAGASNVYIDLMEMNIHDAGFDISAAGFVLNMFRTNSTAAIGQPWMGHRVVGWNNAIDAAFSMGGNMRIGADFSTASFVDGSSTPTRAAMTLKNGQALFGNATNFVQGALPGATQFGTELFGWRDAVGWELVANSTTILSATQAGATATSLGASGSLGSNTTTFGVTMQTRDGIVAKTAAVNTIAPIGRGGAFASIPTLVVAAPPGSGTQATAVVATMGLSRQSYTNIGGVSGGAGYSIGDVLTLSGGTFGTAAQITVASVAGTSVNSSTGAVQTYTLTTVGSYTVLPTSPITLSGGTGTGAKLQGLWKILTVTVTGAGSNYPEFPPPAVTTSGGSPLTNYDCAFTTTMTATQQPLTIGAGANVALMAAGSYGGGTGVVFIANDSVDPTTNPVGGGILYVKAGALTYRGSSGTVTVLGPA